VEGGLTGSVPVEPMTNHAVLRGRRNLQGGMSGFGGMLTAVHRFFDHENLDFLPTEAYTGGLDARHRFADGDWEVKAWLAGSAVRGDTVAIQRLQRAPGRYFQRPDAPHSAYDPRRTALHGAAGDLTVARVAGAWRTGLLLHGRSPGFEVNDLGFLQSPDLALAAAWLGRIQFQPGTVLRNWAVFTNAYQGWTWGGERVVRGANVNGNVQLLNGWGGYAGVEHAFPVLSPDALRGGPALQTGHRTNFWGGFHTDTRRPTRFELETNGNVRHESGGYFLRIGPNLSLRPAPRFSLTLGPSVSRNVDPAQYVAARAPEDGTDYVFGRIDQTTVAMNTRLNVTFTPQLTLELFAQPFVSAGRYGEFKRVEDPRARAFDDRFRTFTDAELRPDGQESGRTRWRYHPDGADPGSYSFLDPSFNFRSLRGNAVLRWEYRPGSTLFLVWQQQRSASEPFGDFRFGRDVGEIFQAPGRNIFLLKATYWIG
jgi:hypothetical protein